MAKKPKDPEAGITKGQIAELLAQDKDGRITREMMDAFLKNPGWMLRRFSGMCVEVLYSGAGKVLVSTSEHGVPLHDPIFGGNKALLPWPAESTRPAELAAAFISLAELLTGEVFVLVRKEDGFIFLARKEDATRG